MSTISCVHELCAADHHEATTSPVRHHRVTSEEDARHRVVAYWIGDKAEGTHIVLTHDDTTVVLTAREATFWTRLLTAGGWRSPAAGTSPGDIAIDLGAADDVLSCLDPDSDPPDFGNGSLDMAIRRVVDRYLGDEDNELHVAATTSGAER